MDKIIIKGLRFLACHGVLDQEKTDPQTFEIDLVIEADLGSAGQSDDLNDTLDYGSIYNEVKEVVIDSSFNLIEALAESIAARVLTHQMASKVTVTVKKMRPPIDGEYDYFAVEIQRSRS